MESTPESTFRDKFIAFVDILGFAGLVETAEQGTGLSPSEICTILKLLGTQNDVLAMKEYGPTICPCAARIQPDVDFRLNQVSDSVVVSAEISPAGAINLINHCWIAAFRLLKKGLLCRGHIRRGSIYHRGLAFFGTGYQEALRREPLVEVFRKDAKERGTPFIEIDNSVRNYIASTNDSCVKEMFSRFTKEDEKFCAIFPFKRLSHNFVINGFKQEWDPTLEKKNNDTMRDIILMMKNKLQEYADQSNVEALQKIAHYEEALNAQLAICDSTDEIIDRLCEPFPCLRI